MELNSLRQAASQGTIALPPPADSEILEDIGVLRSCLLLSRSIGDFREEFAKNRSPITAGKLLLAAEAREELARKDKKISLKDYFISTLIGDTSDEDLLRMDGYINACLDCRLDAREKPLSVKMLSDIANHFLMDKISWRMTGDVLLETPILPDNEVPTGEKLNRQVQLWELYARTIRDIDPYVHLLHTSLYFVALSPLNRDNQRIGTILLQLGLLHRHIDSPFPCIQMGKAKRTNPHLGIEERLHGLRTRQWAPYLRYSLRTITRAFNFTIDLLNSMNRLYNQTLDHLDRLGLSSHGHFVHTIFEYPCCRTGEFSSVTGTRRQMSSHILNDLANADILERIEDGRDKIFVQKRLIELLESSDYTFSPLPRDLPAFAPLYQKGLPGRTMREQVQARLYAPK